MINLQDLILNEYISRAHHIERHEKKYDWAVEEINKLSNYDLLWEISIALPELKNEEVLK